jgi:pilus assembly protein CpaF
VVEARRSDNYYQVKATIFGALIEAIDLAQLAKLDGESAREEIRDIVNEIIAIKNIVMSIAEQEELLDDICNDVLGYGPLEPLLSRDDIADIMVNGAGTVYIEVAGKIQRTGIRFRDNQPVSPTAPASTPSCRRWRSMGLRSPFVSSRRTS